MNTSSKGKILEAIVAMLERSFANDTPTKICQNHKMVDLDGIEREIDVYVEIKTNRKLFKIAIECKNYASTIDITRIEAFHSKCQRLNIDKAIFVTTRGYQSGAIKKATTFNIDLFKIESNPVDDFPEQFDVSKMKFFKRHQKIVKHKAYSSDLFKVMGNKSKKINRFYNDRHQEIKWTTIENDIFDTQREILFSYLFTKSGIALNYTKKLFPTISVTGNLFTKYKSKLYPITHINCQIEIGIFFEEIKPTTVKQYKNLSASEIFASFIQHDFMYQNHQFSLNVVQSTDKKPQFYIMEEGKSTTLLQLNDLTDAGVFDVEVAETENKFTKVNVPPFHYKITKQVGHKIRESAVEPQQVKQKNNLEAGQILLANFNSTNDDKLYFFQVLKKKRKMIIGKIPDPIGLFYMSSVQNYEQAASYEKRLPESNAKFADATMAIDNTYHQYLQSRILTLLMLKSCLLTLFNRLLPANVSLEGLDNNQQQVPKSEAEKVMTFEEKLLFLRNKKIIHLNDKNLDQFVFMNTLVTQIENMKASPVENEKIPYMNVFRDLEKIDLKKSMVLVKKTVEAAFPDFFAIS